MTTGDKVIDRCCIAFIVLIGLVSMALAFMFHMGVIV